jgi:glutamine synthetase
VSFLDPETKEPIPVCPRGTISKAIKKAQDAGWLCMSGVEYEVIHVISSHYRGRLSDISPILPVLSIPRYEMRHL